MTSSAFGLVFGSAFGSVGVVSVVSVLVAALASVVSFVLVVVPSMVGKFYFSSIMLSITEVSVGLISVGFWLGEVSLVLFSSGAF